MDSKGGKERQERKSLFMKIFSELIMMEGRLGDSDCWIAGWLGNQHHGTLSTHPRGGDAVPGC
jgi:hypothetical protein